MAQKLNKETAAFLALFSASVHHSTSQPLSLKEDEWKTVMTLARAHNVLPLVFEKAAENSSFVQTEIYSYYMLESMKIVAAQAQRTEAFLSLYSALLCEGFHPIVMKGIICRQLYGEYCDHRPSGDEDILIQKQEFEQIQKILIANGYLPEQKNVTAAQLNELQEVTFHHTDNGLTLEVHVNPIGHEDGWRRQLNDSFRSVFQNARDEFIQEVPVRTMGHTEHLLFLILHAFKHLTVGGFGIRQIADIMLYIDRYGTACDWTSIHAALKELKAESFWNDLLFIGHQYLGFAGGEEITPCCPEELLAEILDCGVFGNSTQAQRTAVQMTSAAVRSRGGSRGRLPMLINTIFPGKSWMLALHPELQEKPWLLPVRWVQRWYRFIQHNRQNGGNLAAESMKISKKRIEILRKYDIL